MSAVQPIQQHTSPLKEMIPVKKPRKKKEVKVTVTCVGRKEPSKEALDRFIDIYREIVKDNEKKEMNMRLNQANEGGEVIE